MITYLRLFSLSLLLLVPGCTVKDDPAPPGKVIILMYHRITEGIPQNDYERSLADFRADLHYLETNNISTISLDELEDIVTGRNRLSGNAAVITFDDGDYSWKSMAVPLLKEHRMKAVFFLWTSRIGSDSFITWDDVVFMSRYADQSGEQPFTFGSHTVSHQFLAGMSESFAERLSYDAYLDEELGSSRKEIEKRIYGTVTALALPFGDGAGYLPVIEAATRQGYRIIRTSEWGVTGGKDADLMRLPSLPMLDETRQSVIGDYLGL